MEIVDTENIKVPNSVLVSGITDTEIDSELVDFLSKYGTVLRVIRVDNPKSEFHKNVIAEYDSGLALKILESLLPLTFESPSKPGVTFKLRALSKVYLPTAAGNATEDYLVRLQRIARMSGRSFDDVLKEELARCSEIFASQPDAVPDETIMQSRPQGQRESVPVPSSEMTVETEPSQSREVGLKKIRNEEPSAAKLSAKNRCPPMISVSDINPPEIQRVIVEHIVKNEGGGSQMHAPLRLRVFSGRGPRPSNEADYETWRTSVELLMQDPTLSDLQRSRRILDSLLSPASDVIKPLGPQALPAAYLNILDSAFGTVEDGDELFSRFLNTVQNVGEKPSLYCQRLQVALSKAVKGGSISGDKADQHLLRQFCRGCWDNTLISVLQLEQKKEKPPPFAELLLQLRIEEDRQAAKDIRMKMHLGVSKPRATSHCQTVCQGEHKPSGSLQVEGVAQLQKQVVELRAQVAELRKCQLPSKRIPGDITEELRREISELKSQLLDTAKPQKHKTGRKGDGQTEDTKSATVSSKALQSLSQKPKPWYCFQCGEDGHIAASCSNDPNPALVASKRKKLNERQKAWEAHHSPKGTSPLN
nr:zinc finger CCHC domain-containing protein 12-like [Paramormyrops kingsleyae]